MIICAAIKIKGTNSSAQDIDTVVCGLRHGDCFKTIRFLNLVHKREEIQGFINHKGDFLNRKEAFIHAQECGQINAHNRQYRKENHIPGELYSEDLY